MTTKEVADKFYAYLKVGAFDKIYAELFSPDATSDETPGSGWETAKGLDGIHAKGIKWREMVEEQYGGDAQPPVVAGNYFTCFMTMDYKPKGSERTMMEEIGLYKVEDGKIVSEQFFY